MKHAGLFIALVIAMQACSPLSDEQRMEIDRCNDRAYHDRYVNIDSTMFYAEKAERLTSRNRYGWHEAQINKSYVAYQQMDFDKAIDLLSQVTHASRNQFHLLSAHVLYMKIAQRVGDGESFFMQEAGQTAHAGPSDPDKMRMAGFLKIYMIHGCFFPSKVL